MPPLCTVEGQEPSHQSPRPCREYALTPLTTLHPSHSHWSSHRSVLKLNKVFILVLGLTLVPVIFLFIVLVLVLFLVLILVLVLVFASSNVCTVSWDECSEADVPAFMELVKWPWANQLRSLLAKTRI